MQIAVEAEAVTVTGEATAVEKSAAHAGLQFLRGDALARLADKLRSAGSIQEFELKSKKVLLPGSLRISFFF
jgi:hypothetical protein